MTQLQYIVRPTTEEEKIANMPYLTSSMVEAVNTCPRWGIVHNVLGKRFVTGYRQMALEAGSLMHDVFALLNLLHVGIIQNLPDHMHFHGKDQFEGDRWNFIFNEGIAKLNGDPLTMDCISSFERMIYSLIATSDYYDDPNDKNRTIVNLEHVALELLQYWLMSYSELPIYISDRNDPSKPIGIEMSLDAVFEIEKFDDTFDREIPQFSQNIRCIGLADVVYQNPETKKISLGEYKTAANMNEGWRNAFQTRHQLTLYNALLQAYFGKQDTFNTILIGSAIPVRSTSMPTQHFTVDRDQENVQELLNTFLFTSNIVEQYRDNPLATPMFTHSCNRYFNTCSMMDLCTATKDDQEMMLQQMEVEKVLSPSEEKALMRNM